MMKLRHALSIGLAPLVLSLTPLVRALDIENATIADLQAAFKAGSLTSEKLTQLYLARIDAYDKKGPAINAVITLNPKALDLARELDAEYKKKGPRSPLHGIPIVLKDNYDTKDLQTTAGSQLLEGFVPPDDAFVVEKLRAAGAIILAKVNMSEWAGGGGSVGGATDPEIMRKGAVPNGSSTAGGQTLNPHDLTRGPSGSSGGTGAAIAAAFAQFGLGTDTGGSVRGPASAQGLVGLKPTHGLLSRSGIVPLALTYDTGGPIARSTYDIAVSLNVMTGVDKTDPATKKSAGKIAKDYTAFLKQGSLKGARIGIARDFMGKDPEIDRVVESAIAKLKELGAECVDIKYPDYVIQAKGALSTFIMASEFKAQIAEYLKRTPAGYPKTFDDIVARSNDPKTNYRSPEKAYALKYTATKAVDLDDPRYIAARDQGLGMIKAGIDSIFTKYKIDVIVYPTFPKGAWTPIAPNPNPKPAAPTDSVTSLANATGYPDLIMPAGMTKDGLPVTISFFGQAFTEPKLLGYGYDFEQATHARVLPKTTPKLPGDEI